MTNGDLIRAMDNEELAECLNNIIGLCSDCPCEDFCDEDELCVSNILDWLESEEE